MTTKIRQKPAATLRFVMNATPDAVLAAEARIFRVARELGFCPKTCNELARAVGELVLNACTYAYGNDDGQVAMEISSRDDLLEIIVLDNGRGFNCREYFLPDGSLGPRAQPTMGLIRAARLVDRFTIASGSQGTTVRMLKKVQQNE